jgi:hypothetical protein
MNDNAKPGDIILVRCFKYDYDLGLTIPFWQKWQVVRYINDDGVLAHGPMDASVLMEKAFTSKQYIMEKRGYNQELKE